GGRTAVVSDGPVLAVDLKTGGSRRLGDGYRGIERPMLTPDGNWLFCGTWRGEPGRVMECATGAPVLTFEFPSVRGSPRADGPLLLVGLPGQYLIHRAGEWSKPLVLEVDESPLAGAGAFSPDAAVVAVTSLPCTLRLFDARTGAALVSLPMPRRRG